MERLTYDFCFNGVHCNQVKGADNSQCSEVCEREDSCNECPIAKAFDRLAAIENILGDSYNIDRLRELVEADKDGRIKILPEACNYTCGSCANFRRTPGKRSGICSVRSLNRNRRGTELTNAGTFTPSQSRRACKQYAPAKESTEEKLKGGAHGNK